MFRSRSSDLLKVLVACAIVGSTATGCRFLSSSQSFDAVQSELTKLAGATRLEGDVGSAVLVSPKLQGRIMTMRVGSGESTGFVPLKTIGEGETHDHFNNFGGLDRFWIGPEAGQYGVYFPPGAKEFTRDNWQVPADFDRGIFAPSAVSDDAVTMSRDMIVTNLGGVEFQVRVERTVGVLKAADLSKELGVSLPEGVAYAGCYSANRMTNIGARSWDPESGLIGIWILGMFAASDEAVVIAPFHAGDDKDLGPAFNDEYFGKVSVDTPDRLKVVDNAVLFKGDARKVGKFGLSQKRTKGVAGSFDFGKNLLTVVEFTLPETPERYGNSTWVNPQPDPYGGDAFQSYNNGDDTKPGEVAGDDFYELESASPVRALKSGESIDHRHATHQFQGSREAMAVLAKSLLGVDLQKVQESMGL